MRHRSPILVFPPRSFSWCCLSSLGRAWSSCHGSSSSQVSCFCSSFHRHHHRLNHGDGCSCYPSFFCPAWGNWRDVTFFSTIVACFVLDIFPWPEHSSFRVKVVTLLVDLVTQACELSHHESKFSIIIIIGRVFMMIIFFI